MQQDNYEKGSTKKFLSDMPFYLTTCSQAGKMDL